MAAEFLERMGARMRERREALGLSRSDVARRMPGKVSENQVYRWEKGLHQPNPDTLQALAVALESDVSTLMAPVPLQAVETPAPFPSNSVSQLDRIEAALAELTARIIQVEQDLEAERVHVGVRVAEAAQQFEAIQNAMGQLLARRQA